MGIVPKLLCLETSGAVKLGPYLPIVTITENSEFAVFSTVSSMRESDALGSLRLTNACGWFKEKTSGFVQMKFRY